MIKRIKLSEYLQNFSSPLLNPSSPLIQLVPNFINNDNFQLLLASVLNTQYGDYYLRQKFSLEPERAKEEVTAWYAANAYKYQGLQESTELEYNPIENYNMKERGTDTTNGGETDINSYGERTITDHEGQREDTNNIGQKVTDINYPQYQDTTTTSVSPYDTNTYTQSEQQVLQHGTHKDSTTEQTHTDIYTKGSVDSTSVENEREDTFDKEHHNTTEHELTRSGNIGVTTTQQMLASQRDIVNFSIYLTIAKEIMKILCVRVGLDDNYIIIE